jgi:ribosomal protein L31E
MAEKAKATEESKMLRIGLNPVKRFQLKKRAKRAILFIKKFVTKNTRIPVASVFISKEINEAVWKRGVSNIPNKLDLEILVEDKKTARVFLKDGKEKTAYLEQKKEAKKKKEEEKAKEEKKETKEEKEAEKIEEQKKEEKKLKEQNSAALEIKRK